MGIIAWIVFGFVIGLIARAIVPGRQHMGFFATTILGIIGSVIGGLVASAIQGGHGGLADWHSASWIGSILGAIVVLLIAGGLFTGSRRRAVV
jgi:uncharacterized membrane protein YeaQ/YmgE (transglycosylase-associated protein family)